jgi:hypothetical protein
VDEPWAKAAAIGPEHAPADLWDACVDELEALWGDLSTARREAYRNGWSVHCDWLTERIVVLSRLAGVTDWDHVPTDLVLDGVYKGILIAAGLPLGPEPTRQQLSALAYATEQRPHP